MHILKYLLFLNVIISTFGVFLSDFFSISFLYLIVSLVTLILFLYINLNTQKLNRQNIEIALQDELLKEQSKSAEIGRMFGAITHQLRQPIQILNYAIINMQSVADPNIENKKLDDAVNQSLLLTKLLSQTIDDFTNFLKPSKEKTIFDISKPILKIEKLFTKIFKKDGIYLDIKYNNEENYIFGIASEITQVLMIMINNSKDSIKTKQIENGHINIMILKLNNEVEVIIEDNGIGIDDTISNKIFDLYFSTKENYGSGIGLYICKKIIDSFGGIFIVYKQDVGARIGFKIPIAKNGV